MTNIKKEIEYLILESRISNYQISKETGIAQSTLSDYSKGKTDIGRMPLDRAIKLHDYYKKELGEMKEVYIASIEETVTLGDELKGYGVGKYYSNDIESVESTNDFGIGTLYTLVSPDLGNATIYNENQSVMIGQLFDLAGNLYQVTWTKKEGIDLEDMNGLDEFANWEEPHSVELI